MAGSVGRDVVSENGRLSTCADVGVVAGEMGPWAVYTSLGIGFSAIFCRSTSAVPDILFTIYEQSGEPILTLFCT